MIAENSNKHDWIPFTTVKDGKKVAIDITMVEDDQQAIMTSIMTKLKEWMECATSDNQEKAQSFKPMRLTVPGSAGAGKSFLIKCLVNTVRNIFESKDVIHVCAPTGAAAFNVGGQTLHRKFGINPHKPSAEPSRNQKDTMEKEFKRALVIVVDERGMLTGDTVGAAERNTASVTHGGGHEAEDFGGIPIVIFVGDDYQVPPPTNTQKGAFDSLSGNASISQQKLCVAARGMQIFRDMTETCMTLTKTRRQNEDQDVFKEILQKVRIGEADINHANTLMDLHLSRYSNSDVKKITSSGITMHLFAKKAPKNEFNYKRLSQISDENNPVALIKSKWTSVSGKQGRAIKSHFKNPPQNATVLCRDAIVCISEKNFDPETGLYNNAIGTIDEIIFEENENPNSGDQPKYIAVNFPQYCGPTWDANNPKVS
jgi:hypothetical protein